jgi:hypothetical protein
MIPVTNTMQIRKEQSFPPKNLRMHVRPQQPAW